MTREIGLIIHWTAGAPVASPTDKQHYHFIVQQDRKVVRGVYRPAANFRTLSNGMQYAAHTGGGNSFRIGVALCGMAGRRNGAWRFPLKHDQCETAWKLIAELCNQYKIPVTPDRVMTHYEFGRRHPGTDSAGKIDITHLPFVPALQPDQVGDYIRGKVQWYLDRL